MVYVYYMDPINLNDTSVCEDSIVLLPGSYERYLWSNGSTDSTITIDSNSSIMLTVINHDLCSLSASANMQIYGEPKLELHSDTALCCNDNGLGLSTLLGSSDPKNGIWNNFSYPSSLQAGIFRPQMVCGARSRISYLSYRFVNSTTGCEYYDSIHVIVNPLPDVLLEDKLYCQTDEEIDLETDVVLIPTNVIGDHEWNCIACNGNDLNDFLINKGSTAFPEFWLLIDSAHYHLQKPEADTLRLEFAYSSALGCIGRDTVSIIIAGNPPNPALSRQDEWLWISNPSASVKWYRNGVYLNALTDTIIQMNLPGNYSAKNVNQFGCESDISDSVTRTISINDLLESGISIQPNPSQGLVHISWSNSDLTINSLRLYDELGRSVDTYISIQSKSLDVTWKGASGIYYLELEVDDVIIRQKLIRIE